METKLEYLLGNGNVLNTFEIQKSQNQISQKDGYLHSKVHYLTLDLLCTAVLGTIFFSALKLVCFSDLLNLKYAYLCL